MAARRMGSGFSSARRRRHHKMNTCSLRPVLQPRTRPRPHGDNPCTSANSCSIPTSVACACRPSSACSTSCSTTAAQNSCRPLAVSVNGMRRSSRTTAAGSKASASSSTCSRSTSARSCSIRSPISKALAGSVPRSPPTSRRRPMPASPVSSTTCRWSASRAPA